MTISVYTKSKSLEGWAATRCDRVARSMFHTHKLGLDRQIMASPRDDEIEAEILGTPVHSIIHDEEIR